MTSSSEIDHASDCDPTARRVGTFLGSRGDRIERCRQCGRLRIIERAEDRAARSVAITEESNGAPVVVGFSRPNGEDRQLSILLIVEGVRVQWRRGRKGWRWRCDAHATNTRPECDHAREALPLILDRLAAEGIDTEDDRSLTGPRLTAIAPPVRVSRVTRCCGRPVLGRVKPGAGVICRCERERP